MEINNNQTMSKKMTGIVAYLSYIGFILAYLCGDKEGAKFHLNQALIIHLISLTGFVPYIGRIVMPLTTILWFIGFIYATREEEKEVPVVGSLRLLQQNT